MNTSARNWQRIALAAVVTLPLLLYAYATVFARFMADDFCAYDQVHDWGVFGHTIVNYVLWSGRVVHNFSAALLRYLPAHAESLFAVGFLVFWWVSLYLVIRLILKQRAVPAA